MFKRETVLYTVVVTVAIVIALLFIAYLLVALFSPITLAHAYNNINHNISIKYYEKAYNRSKDLDDLYNLVNKSIEFKKDRKLVKYYPILEKETKYQALVDYIDELNYNESDAIEANLFRSCEDNRLKTRYVSALVNTDAHEAFVYAYSDMMNPDSREDYNFISTGLTSRLSGVLEYMDNDYITDLTTYYDYIKTSYTDSKSGEDRLISAILCYRALNICQYMLLLDREGVQGLDGTALNVDKEALTQEYSELLAH